MGVASIEFAMLLPVILAFFGLTLFVIQAHTAKHLAAIDAETSALTQAILAREDGRIGELTTFPLSDSNELQMLLAGFAPDLDAASGMVRGEREILRREVKGESMLGSTPLQESLTILSHSWESELLGFPTTRDEQPPLTLPKSIRAIAPELIGEHLREFTSLLDLAGGGTNRNSHLTVELESATEAALRTTRTEITRLDRRISELRKELDRLIRDQSVDEPTLRQLNRTLSELVSQRERLRRAIALL